MAENWIQSMNRCTGPDICTCPITGPHDPRNTECHRNRESFSKFQRERIKEALRHDAEVAQCLICAANHYCPKHNPEPPAKAPGGCVAGECGKEEKRG